MGFGDAVHLLEENAVVALPREARGVHEGWSTEYWARWGARVVAVDVELMEKAKQRLQLFGDAVHLLEENAVVALPREARKLTEPAAVVIDGPKREAALKLAREVFETSPHVQFIAIHDMRHFKGGST